MRFRVSPDGVARSSHTATRTDVRVARRRLKIDSQSLLGLDPSREEDALPVPWPPRGGLDPAQDPFHRSGPSRPAPRARPAAPAEARAEARPPAGAAPDELPVPLLALELEEAALAAGGKTRWSFTRDRAVLVSVVLHALFALFVVTAPPRGAAPNPDELPPDLLGLNKLWAIPPQDPPIPVRFYPAPGPRAAQPGPKPLPSDLDRKAGGGDPRLPKAETPRSVAGPGIRELAPGRRGEGRGEGESARSRPAQPVGGGGAAAGGAPEAPKDDAGLKGLDGLAARPLQQVAPGAAGASPGAPPGQAGPRTEAKAGGGGDDGGGWDSEGGFVDNGPLSFDTKGYEWGPYAAEMIRKIKRNWEIPKLAHYGMKGRLVVRFFLMKDGRVEGLRLLVSSGIPPYDNASLQAIRNSSPFRPLPADFPNPREGVTITFLYNMRPEDVDKPDAPKDAPPLLPR